MKPQSGVRVVHLGVAAAVSLLLSWLALRWYSSGGRGLPNPGWVALVVMVFLGGGLLVAGWQVKKVRDGTDEAAVSPLRAARTLVLGQAAALTGAVLVGWYVASILVVAPNADVESQRNRLLLFIAHAVVTALLATAGMLVQRFCRLDDTDDTPDHGHGDRVGERG